MWSSSAKGGSMKSKNVLIDQGVRLETVIEDECVWKGEQFLKEEFLDQKEGEENDKGRLKMEEEEIEDHERQEIEKTQSRGSLYIPSSISFDLKITFILATLVQGNIEGECVWENVKE